MYSKVLYRVVLSFAALVVLPAQASFHNIQVEQVIGGVSGNTSAQAIQIRLRLAGETDWNPAVEIFVEDANGANPITIIDIPSDITNGAVGDRILITSAGFGAETLQPPVAADFTMTNLIPASYLPAGRLVFRGGATVYWSLCWGGASYTGPTIGSLVNDADGDFGPCFAGPLTSSTEQALQFTGVATAQSTTNAADYANTAGPAVFTNNDGASQTVPVELLTFTID